MRSRRPSPWASSRCAALPRAWRASLRPRGCTSPISSSTAASAAVPMISAAQRLDVGSRTAPLGRAVLSATESEEMLPMEINLPRPLAELTKAFRQYEAALVSTRPDVLDRLFLNSPLTVRSGVAENLYGHADIS